MSQPEIAPLTKHLTQAQITAYATASGDFNPIHIDEEFAKTTPFGGTIAHGMLVLAFISEVMTKTHGDQWRKAGELDVRFRNPARPGDTITARASPGKAEEGVVKYNVECVNQNGDVLISGTAQIRTK